jgi:hypothetical protein
MFMLTIKMPVTPPSAYDPKRPANALLLAQVHELEKAVSEAGRRVRRKKPKTEGQVAAYMRHLNRALHQQVLLPRMKRRPLDVPLDGQSPTRIRIKSRPGPRKRVAATTSRKKKLSHSRKRRRSQRS